MTDSAAKTSGKSPVLEPQAHGGVLRRGGTNKGGTGRPSSVIQKRCQGSFKKRIPILEDIADGKVAGALVSDRMKAVDLLGKYAGLQKVEHEHSGPDGGPIPVDLGARERIARRIARIAERE